MVMVGWGGEGQKTHATGSFSKEGEDAEVPATASSHECGSVAPTCRS